MHRRQFLGLMAASTLTPGVGRAGWLRGPTGLESRGHEDPIQFLHDQILAARQVGKPLLVLIGPEPPPPENRNLYQAQLGDFAYDMGALFEFGGTAFWTTLALCHVCVATQASLERVASQAGLTFTLTKNAWAVMVETHGSGFACSDVVPLTSRFRSRVEFEEEAPYVRGWKLMRQNSEPRAQEVIKAIIAAPHSFEHRAAQANAANGQAATLDSLKAATYTALQPRTNVGQMRGWIEQGMRATAFNLEHWLSPGDEVMQKVDRGAANILARYSSLPTANYLLRHAARKRVYYRNPPGGAWIRGGCGASFLHAPKGEIQIGMSCGMGHSPSYSKRFLAHYVPVALEPERLIRILKGEEPRPTGESK